MTPKPITKAQAVEAYNGNVSALARALGLTPQAVHQWPDGPIAEGYMLKLRFVLLPAHAWDKRKRNSSKKRPAELQAAG